MRKSLLMAAAVLALLPSCKMNENPLLTASDLPYGAPQFDKITNADYLPAFEAAVAEAKAEIDAIVANPEEPTFENTVEALEFSGEAVDKVAGIFYNLLECDSDPEKQEIAEKVSPMMTELSLYSTLNEGLFQRVKAVWDKRESLGLDPVQYRLLENNYKGFVRGGALLSPEDKEKLAAWQQELSLLSLQFSNNSLAATNAFKLNLTDEADLEGLPEYVREMGAATAAENDQEGWTFDLSYPSLSPFLTYSARRDLREQIWRASNTKAVGGEFDNTEVCRKIADLRIKIANLLGYETYAYYAVEDRMVGSVENIHAFLGKLAGPTIPAARREVAEVEAYAKANGFDGDVLMPWDFSYWSEKLRVAEYDLSDEMLKPYFQLDSCIDAVLGLATRLYGIQFEPRPDIPAYHPDVRVFDVKDADGKHLALFYADFFPRASKRSGAWMTEFRGQSIKDGVERRPFVSIVTNFSKPTASAPSLLTHYELTTFLHEFGHALHGILTEGRYGSMTGTNVDHDFVELPSQIMENWGYEPEYLRTFARHYQTGEVIPDALIDKIVAARNFQAAYFQARQLRFGYIDLAWNDIKELPAEGAVEYERAAAESVSTLPYIEGTCSSTTFSHIFSGGYAAGYYSYKWAEVLEADAFSLFEQEGIFNTDVAASFRENILSKGDSEPAGVLYRRFRGHDPEPEALLRKLGIIE